MIARSLVLSLLREVLSSESEAIETNWPFWR